MPLRLLGGVAPGGGLAAGIAGPGRAEGVCRGGGRRDWFRFGPSLSESIRVWPARSNKSCPRASAQTAACESLFCGFRVAHCQIPGRAGRRSARVRGMRRTVYANAAKYDYSGRDKHGVIAC